MAKKIPLQNGMFAIVDDEDYERVSQYNWVYYVSENGAERVFSNRNKNTPITLSYFILNLDESADNIYVNMKNGDRLDFRKNNLVINTREKWTTMRKGCRNTTSKYKGVCWDKSKNKWNANIKKNGVKKNLGCFINEEEAAFVYNQAAIEIHGKQAYQNVIGKDNNAQPIDWLSKEQKLPSRKRKKASSKYKGVDFHSGRSIWRSRITIDKKTVYLGEFTTEIEAAKAYDKKAYELYGDKAILNFPELVGAL